MIDGRDPTTGIGDYDLFYFDDTDLSWDAEDVVIRRAAAHGDLQVYAPHGYDDLFAQRLRPNPLLAPREVYERNAARWNAEWPGLIVDPWPRSRER